MDVENGMLHLGGQNLGGRDDDQESQSAGQRNRSSMENFGQFSPNFGQGSRTTGKKKHQDAFNEAFRGSAAAEKPLTAG